MSLNSWLSLLALLVASSSALISILREKHSQQGKRWHWQARLILTIVAWLVGSALIYRTELDRRLHEAEVAAERDVDRAQVVQELHQVQTQLVAVANAQHSDEEFRSRLAAVEGQVAQSILARRPPSPPTNFRAVAQ